MTVPTFSAPSPRLGPAAASTFPLGWRIDEFERLANSGGPMSRSRRERLTATVLAQDNGAVRCPRVLRIGLDFGQQNPLACARSLLEACDFADEREARAALALPLEPCLCRPDPAPSPAAVVALPPRDALFQALVLGLCTAWCYDPRRPVLWTRTSLTRQLELFDGRGFYV